MAASAIQVRWAEPADSTVSWRVPSSYAIKRSKEFDRLLTTIPDEIVARKVERPGAALPAEAAVAPLWVSVRVPADAVPGHYRGTLKVQARGATAAAATFVVPIELTVHGWRIPDPKDFTVHHNFYQSHESVARYYDVPFWSDKHFDLMGRNLKLAGEVGGKLCLVHLLKNSHCQGNAQSMVRWIR
jgi:hypothetical protein